MAGLLDEEELLPVFSNPNIARQGARARALAARRNVNTLPDPRTYAAVQGLLGTRPDEMKFSVLNPAYEDIRRVADPAFAVGTALGVAPLMSMARFSRPIQQASAASQRGAVRMPGAARAPQEEALRLAQQRAALPVEQGGLGLPKDNTPMDRARAMGFDTEAFHGTGLQPNFDDPSGPLLQPNFKTFIETVDGIPTRSALFVSTSPKVASGYATRQEGQVLPVVIKSGKQAWSDAKGQHWKDYFGRHGVIEANARGARSSGYDTYRVKNVVDPFDPSYAEVADTIGVLNPENIRSRFAAFDPFRRTAAIAATMGVAAPDLLARTIDDEERRRQLLPGLLAP